jgi:Nucleotidyl transferase AbiEii toxin, Type IV TA system
MTHYDILPDEQKALLLPLKPTRRLGYTLYGGTAIAIQIGHRQSIDFDFFSDKPLDEDRIKRAIPALASAKTTQREPEAWSMLVRPEGFDREVKVSFFGGLGFGRVGTPLLTDKGEIALASLDDLMGHKLKVLLQRVEAKDYLDIAAMIRAGQSIEHGIGAAKAMFDTFPPVEAMRTLTYFEGGDLDRVGQEDRRLLVRAASQVGKALEVPIISRQLSATSAT